MLDEFQLEAQKIAQHLQEQLKQVRTGRAQPSLVENFMVLVESYGATMPLRELASISAPDTNLLVIQPFNPQTLKDVEKGLSQNDLGLSAVVHDDVLHIAIPPLTQERRQELVKVVKSKVEESKIRLRGLRTDYKQMIEDQEGESGVSEDDIQRQLEQLQKMVESATEKLEWLGDKKEEELMQL
ncbi:ribosome recycling factor [Candidatus Woesebacteria bacterium]|nr:ribosome recycling factor [Candidatus Woesebacteria bacterium]MCD8546771.1 ribosome recycling factor [Candidatus Woesebacteria bacterium]